MNDRGRALVVIGDSLLDRDIDGTAERLAPDAPVPVVQQSSDRSRPGGAALAAVLAAADGREVSLITPLCDDEPGARLAESVREAGVHLMALQRDGATPENIRVCVEGRPIARIDRGDRRAREVGGLPANLDRSLRGAGAILVSDYGGGLTHEPRMRLALSELSARIPIVWDPHARGSEPTPGTRLTTPNRAELEHFAGAGDGSLRDIAQRAEALRGRWSTRSLAVTLGRRGAMVLTGDGVPQLVPPEAVESGDPCGAGDRFAGRAAERLADGALVSEAVASAVQAAAAFVRRGGAIAFGATSESESLDAPWGGRVRDVVRGTSVAGEVVVATSGCFDLLHTGHVGLLQAARRLGDRMVVLLNSDGSVRRLKGPERPVTPVGERAQILRALGCVDEVVVFDEDNPTEALERLRPDIFVKGGDYAGADLPEARTLATWGGQVLTLPFVPDRSTTRLLHHVAQTVAR